MKGAHKTNDLRRWYGFLNQVPAVLQKNRVERGTAEFFGVIRKGFAL